MAFRSLFGVITLQVATAILATVFFLVGFLVMGVNVFSSEKRDVEPDSWPVNLTLVWIFVFLTNVTGWFMFMSSYLPSRPLCYVAMFFITLIVVYWGTLTVISFVNHPTHVRRVCVGYRCAESFWLGSFKFRAHPFFGADVSSLVPDETDVPHPIRPFLINRRNLVLQLAQRETTDESVVDGSAYGESELSTSQNSSKTKVKTKRFSNTNLQIASSIRDKNIKEVSNHNYYNYSPSNSRVVESLGMKKIMRTYEYLSDDHQYDNPEGDATTNDPDTSPKDVGELYETGRAFVGAVVFALVNIMFFVLSMVTVWAFSQELKWINPREKRYQTPAQCYEMSSI